MWWSTCLSLCAILASVRPDSTDSREVKISQGTVKGYRDPEGDLFAFYNIPYATAPSGTARFKAPLPPPVWLNTFEAVDKGVICPQTPLGPVHSNLTQQENCLIVNVFVPDTEEKNLPVVVAVHGGAFQIGYGNWVELKELMRINKVIVVDFNYRLGVHGFLCLGTEDAPGNAGLKDQVALLRWVNRNIGSFGGNPDDVTLIGYSAGSAAVDLLLLSKSVRGLFHKIILESGSNLAPFAVQLDPLKNAKDYAKQLKFERFDDIYALEEFYKTASYQKLTSDAFIDRPDSTFMFVPCVERDVGEEIILNDAPINLLQNKQYPKVPMLIGFANMEGLMRIDLFDEWRTKMNKRFSDFLPADLHFKNESQKKKVAKIIKEFYFGDRSVNTDGVLNYVNYFSDVIFMTPALRSIKLLTEAGHDQVYLYEYSFVDENVPVVPHTDVRGANHCAQTMAVVDGPAIAAREDVVDTEEYREMRKTMRTLWNNFITTGKPVPEGSYLPKWPSINKDLSPYMSLGNKIELKDTLAEERVKFWDGIYEIYYRIPLPPSPLPPKHTEL